MKVNLKMSLSQAPQKFNTFNTFNTFAIFAKFAKFARFANFTPALAYPISVHLDWPIRAGAPLPDAKPPLLSSTGLGEERGARGVRASVGGEGTPPRSSGSFIYTD